MEQIRYKPGEAVRWLESGAKDLMRSARKKGQGIIQREGKRTIGKDIKEAAGAVVDVGKSAIAELLHRQAEATEYALGQEGFEVVRSGSVKSIRYDAVTSIQQSGDRYNFVLEHGGLAIKPHAYIVAGRIRVPVGWSRNGIEVPYEVLLDELSARCKVNITAL